MPRPGLTYFCTIKIRSMATLTQSFETSTLFADNAGRLDYSLSEGECIYLVLNQEYHLIPTAYSTYHLSLDGILRACPLSVPDPTISHSLMYNKVSITAGPKDIGDSTGRVTLNFFTYKGGLFGKSADEAADFCYFKPLSTDGKRKPALRTGKEKVSYIAQTDQHVALARADITLKSGLILSSIILYNSPIYSFSLQGYIFSINANYQTICNAVANQRPDVDANDIVSWKVWYSNGRINAEGVEFYLIDSRLNYREFVFINSISGIEHVISRGTFKIAPTYNFASFRNNGDEGQLDSQPVEQMEVSTGPIDNAKDRRLWLDMLRSDTVYMVDSDGEIRKIIIDDCSPSFTLKEVNEITFKCHYAGRMVGNGTKYE